LSPSKLEVPKNKFLHRITIPISMLTLKRNKKKQLSLSLQVIKVHSNRAALERQRCLVQLYTHKKERENLNYKLGKKVKIKELSLLSKFFLIKIDKSLTQLKTLPLDCSH
jgi:hypothetical protein